MTVFLETGADIEQKSIGFSSPLHAAATAGQISAVAFLLERGAAAEAKPGAMYSPLGSSAQHGHWAVFALLLQRIHDVSAERIALEFCASVGRLADVCELMNRGLEKIGRYAIAAAAKNGQFEVVRHLVDSGVAWEEYGALRIVENAREAGFTALCQFLEGAAYNAGDAIAASKAARENRLAALEAQRAFALSRKAAANPGERVALLLAVTNAASVGVMKPVLDSACVPADHGTKVTPLIAAAMIGDIGLVEALLAAGVKPGVKLPGKHTAASAARGPARIDIQQALASAQATGKGGPSRGKKAKPEK